MRAIEKRLRERIKLLEEEKSAIEADRQKFRNHFALRFRWWLKMLGKNQTPSLPCLIENDAKALNNFSWFHW